MMTSDPYRAPELPPDTPAHDHLEVVEPRSADKASNLWIPIAVSVAIVLGLSYFYTHSTDIQPSARADASGQTMPRQTPSPN
jgi:hypothetical protein